MTELIQSNFRLRKSFARVDDLLPVPDLLEAQKNSFKALFDLEADPSTTGLDEIFKNIFPVSNQDGTIVVNYQGYEVGDFKYDETECRYRGVSYAVPIKVNFELAISDLLPNGKLHPREIRSQDVYFGEFPIMTEKGSFIVNGTERVVVTQLHRSPGLSFILQKKTTSKKYNYVAKIIPSEGSWLVFEFDSKEICYVQIDTKRKLHVTAFLKALGYSSQDIVKYFYDYEEVILRKKKGEIKLFKKLDFVHLLGKKMPFDFVDDSGNVIVKAYRKLNQRNIDKIIAAEITEIPIDDGVISYFPYNDIVSKDGDLLKGIAEEITGDDLEYFYENKVKKFKIIYFNQVSAATYIKDTLVTDKIDDLVLRDLSYCVLKKHDVLPEICDHLKFSTEEQFEEFKELAKTFTTATIVKPEVRDALNKLVYKYIDRKTYNEEVRKQALKEIFRRMRPNEPATDKDAEQFLEDMIFNPDRYDLSRVGRLKLNGKLSGSKKRYQARLESDNPPWEPPEDMTRVLRREDIIEIVKYLMDIKNNGHHFAKTDDIDHLSNRRTRGVGELAGNEIKKGLWKIKKSILEKMLSSTDIDLIKVHELINPKPLYATLNEFYGSSQLSQFMDQTNPLSEITHKRRLSALGPSGLTRERAGYDVRDVHASHYGRICPIETPEGQNIGLITSLAIFVKINRDGFLETPYRKVTDGVVSEEIRYFHAMEEEDKIIAQAKVKFDKKTGEILYDYVYARENGNFLYVKPEELEWMDISTYQIISVAASLIPFLQNDDANRALMGANMQRQAVPLVKTQAPFIGTGMERNVGVYSRSALVAKNEGVVEYVDANRIVVKVTSKDSTVAGAEADIYNLEKYRRSNQNSCFNQVPIVKKGDYVKVQDVLADGAATDMGEISLGKNLMVAFMPWHGYNYEDAILISEKVVKQDIYTSIHIQEEDVLTRDAKLGPEIITRDVPGAKDEKLGKLDESGIIRIGSKIEQDDILVGKITPRAEQQLTPEERLLRAIFGSKAKDVKDTSLRVSSGIVGTVIDVKIFTRKGIEKDSRTTEIEKYEKMHYKKDAIDRKKIIKSSVYDYIKDMIIGKEAAETLFNENREKVIARGAKFDKENVKLLTELTYEDIKTTDKDINKNIIFVLENLDKRIKDIDEVYQRKLKVLAEGDELIPGVRKMVKVILAIKRKLRVGDKMSGRHGNKGVVSRILAEEDLPYFPDGTPVDIVLNPLGIPSRMNIGQVLEMYLGWAAKALGEKLYKMYKDGASIKELKEFLYKIYDNPEESKFIDAINENNVQLFVEKHKDGLFFSNPVFDGINEDGIREKLRLADLPEDGKTVLFNGRTGEAFDQRVTVGIMYILKLHHLVDEKIHARATGPYSLVTQQPLGGKAQSGGQRLGEMEVWALEAYGAAHILREFLTVKSDDIKGRDKMYEAIVKGENILQANIPEAFNVLLKELEAICLKIEQLDDDAVAEYEEFRRARLSEIMD